MGDIVVHGMIGSPFVRSVLVALEEKGQFHRLNSLRLDALKTPEYRALHPFGRVPVFEQDGLVVYETQAILRHIDRASTTLDWSRVTPNSRTCPGWSLSPSGRPRPDLTPQPRRPASRRSAGGRRGRSGRGR